MNRKVITEAFDHILRWELEHGAEERRFTDEEVFMDFEEKIDALEMSPSVAQLRDTVSGMSHNFP